jgi:hypothetical protein
VPRLLHGQPASAVAVLLGSGGGVGAAVVGVGYLRGSEAGRAVHFVLRVEYIELTYTNITVNAFFEGFIPTHAIELIFFIIAGFSGARCLARHRQAPASFERKR